MPFQFNTKALNLKLFQLFIEFKVKLESNAINDARSVKNSIKFSIFNLYGKNVPNVDTFHINFVDEVSVD